MVRFLGSGLATRQLARWSGQVPDVYWYYVTAARGTPRGLKRGGGEAGARSRPTGARGQPRGARGQRTWHVPAGLLQEGGGQALSHADSNQQGIRPHRRLCSGFHVF